MNQPVLAVIHVAGRLDGQVQRCSRCGAVLSDTRGAAVEVRRQELAEAAGLVVGWPVGEEVLVTGNFSAVVSALQPDRPKGDEVQCG